MKKYIQFIVVLLFGLLSPSLLIAQDRYHTGDFSIKPVRFEQQGDLLFIDIDIVLEEMKVNSSKSIDIVPLLVSSTQTNILPKISMKGGNNYQVYERKLAFMSMKEKETYEAPLILEKINKKQNRTLQYRYTLPYEKWMADASLDVYHDICGCGEIISLEVKNIVDKVTLEQFTPYIVKPHVAYIQPKAEEVKQREKQMECFLDFEVNQTYIRTEYMNNPRELAKIRGMIDELKNDLNISVNRLDIIGFASPEGTLTGNKRLSEGRAKALRDYLSAHYEFPRKIYHIEFGGENWNGLEQSLLTYDMDHKDEILNILQNTPDSEQKKKKLQNLRGGVPYRYLLRNIYPALRVAICKVDYNIKNFNIEEAKEVIKKHPQNLSLNEMFLLAITYPNDSRELTDIFDTAVKIYPEDPVANLNAAAAALVCNDLISAERYITRADSQNFTAEYNNVKGMIALLKENYDEAETYLKIAAKDGLDVAKLNLNELINKKNEK